jgi:hypothetical protein
LNSILASRFLTALANLSEDAAELESFRSKFGSAFVLLGFDPEKQTFQEVFRNLLRPLQNCLRSIWLAHEMRTKEWLVEELSKLVHAYLPTHPRLSLDSFAQGTVSSIQLPPLSFLERSAFYLRRHLDHLRWCPNPDCAHPFFIATHGNRKYCSRKCAEPYRLASNRHSWHKHGKQWRKQQAPKSKASRRRKGVK